VTRERVRQLELSALARLSSVRDMKELRDCVSD
jgi:DNA-directed RNA polymerase sigma subunit (sigma70/sigma32)